MHPWSWFPDRPLPDEPRPDPNFTVAPAFAKPLTEADTQHKDEEDQ